MAESSGIAVGIIGPSIRRQGLGPYFARFLAANGADGGGATATANGAASSAGDSSRGASDGGASVSHKRKAEAGYGRFDKILRACRPTEGKPLIFEVQCADGTKALVPNATLRSEAPLVLVEDLGQWKKVHFSKLLIYLATFARRIMENTLK